MTVDLSLQKLAGDYKQVRGRKLSVVTTQGCETKRGIGLRIEILHIPDLWITFEGSEMHTGQLVLGQQMMHLPSLYGGCAGLKQFL